MIEVKAKLKNVRISAKKLRLVADAIRGLEVVQVLDRLQVIFKKSSPIISKLLQSAVANALDKYNIRKEDLLVKKIIVNESKALKRWRPVAFGRAHPFKKHSAHIEIVLGIKEGVRVTSKEKKKEEIETVDLTEAKKRAKDKKGKDDLKDKVKDNKIDKKPVGPQEGKRKDSARVKKG
ncbi:MAG: 50S ribosomal protein L22 [Candidatus Komeilibacteria bacterium CG11_big_fil_rev_8_21_14_0_20_36_20]|uniref:Large ribosomal subunit protein uL22 n=1 Tax=Candidatus Komeilibacteria bacterium CG11_big_fil_rev_8_21_14_0_20_36_20 TaxID=1974477 RepID=A0A2H0NDQ0_9BACT|nr:MAG: 50S ribosomal protein L22 [Candidatus Komeilibacteria bacterium CG11_big_fil_rev_8_21_14_0_20_36_20]PIR81401.1 MAG: 50S ribosomal protein L22 [Candidatus Komeilibacteria bacterium CG10_big_fil_rev_8_21_14_0_10_36_65]PJC55126.1 MAG: 50S ribosomal protein L22 [Candidatus Komeilibacteria bacterium CG_4_9_14_0_2_um_filter_36_13]